MLFRTMGTVQEDEDGQTFNLDAMNFPSGFPLEWTFERREQRNWRNAASQPSPYVGENRRIFSRYIIQFCPLMFRVLG